MADAVKTMAYAISGGVPWHGKGVPLTDEECTDGARMMQASRLGGWGLTKIQAGANVMNADGEVSFLPADDKYWVMRTDEIDPAQADEEANEAEDGMAVHEGPSYSHPLWGPVTSRYEVLQNEEAFAFFEPAVEAGLIRYETAIALQDGRRVCIMAKVVNSTKLVVPGDEVELYLLLGTAHDGSSSVFFKPTGTRVVCQNTLNAALKENSERNIGIPHTRKMREALKFLSEHVVKIHQRFDNVVEVYQAMAATPVTEENAKLLLNFLRPDPAGGGSAAKATEWRDAVMELTSTSPGHETAEGTAWGLYNGVTYYLTHQYGRDEDTRFIANHWNVSAKVRRNAFEVFARVARGEDIEQIIASEPTPDTGDDAAAE